jgi:hypothetical protein
MDFWTLMTIGYNVMEHNMQFSIWLPSEEACWNMLMGSDALYEQINATEGHCDVSEIHSNLVRPKVRPW